MRRHLMLAATTYALLASLAGASTTVSDAARMFTSVCVNAFPDQAAMEAAARATGLVVVSDDPFTVGPPPGVIVPPGENAVILSISSGGTNPSGRNSASPRCSLQLLGRVERADVSNALQAELGRFQVNNLVASRRGVALSASFERGGVHARVRVSSFAGAGVAIRLQPELP